MTAGNPGFQGSGSSSSLPPGLSVPPLDDVLERLNRDQVLRVARRFSGQSVTAVGRARELVGRALNDPRQLDAVVAGLHPTELALLQELRRRGGLASGWTLHVFARLRGLSAVPSGLGRGSGVFGSYEAASFTGANLLWPLLAEGLLLPAALPNPWLISRLSFYSYAPSPQGGGGMNPLVFADPRLLARLPDAPTAPLTTPVAPAQATPGAAPGAVAVTLVLKLQELLRVLRAQGGLALTKAGTPSKAALTSLRRGLPGLPDVDLWLTLALRLGFLEADGNGSRIQVSTAALETLPHTDLAALPGALLAASSDLPRPEDAASRLYLASTVRTLLSELLRALPHPTTEAEVLRLMLQVTPPEFQVQRYDYRMKSDPAVLAGWLGPALRGLPSTLGLVQVSGDGPRAVVTPRHLMPESLGAGPAWILQPNFELLVYPAQLTPAHRTLLMAAEALRFDAQTATYRLTRESVYGALEAGLSLEALLEGLQAGSATPLSPGVGRSLMDWAARRERVTLHLGVTLLEYPSAAARDAALKRQGGTAIGDTLRLPPTRAATPGVLTVRYDQPPRPSLKFAPDGSFTASGPLDFLTRQLLGGRTGDLGGGRLALYPAQPGDLPATFLADLETRTVGTLPGTLRLQLGVWSGQTPPPAVAAVTLLAHPQAALLAQHPRLQGLLGPALGPGLLSALPGQEAALRFALVGLGLRPGDTLPSAAQAIPNADLVTLPDTRQKRTFLEEAIRSGQRVLTQYQEEKYGGWSGKSLPGRRRLEELTPLRIDRDGSTPYLIARPAAPGESAGVSDPDTKADELRIRIQYIMAMALR